MFSDLLAVLQQSKSLLLYFLIFPKRISNHLSTMFKIISLLVASAAFLTEVTAHPGVDHTEEIARRDAYFDTLQRKDISHCASHLAARGLDKKISARREAKIQALRAKRGLHSMNPTLIALTRH